MQIGRFRAQLWPTLATLIGLAMLLSLGTWQFTRYAAKEVLETQQAAKIDLPTVPVQSLAEFTADAVDHRRILATGSLDLDYVFLIKHRIFRGNPGFWIVTPLRLAGDDQAILVNHGWIPKENGEEVAKAFIARADHPKSYEGLVHVLGYVVADRSLRERLAAGHSPAGEPLTYVESYDIEAIASALPYTVNERPVVFTLDPRHTGAPYPIASFDHITEPYLSAEKHLGYAITWYSLALALIAMFITHGLGMLRSQPMGPRT